MNVRNEVESKGEILSTSRNEAWDVIQKVPPKNPGAAKFYGMPKIHKVTETNLPFRPIVSSVGTLARWLEGYLAKQLNPLVGTFSSSHIKNNVDFKENLRNYSLGNNTGDFRMLSLDVQSLFTQVPRNDVLDFLERKVNTGLFSPPIPFSLFLRIIEICANECFFRVGWRYLQADFRGGDGLSSFTRFG